MLPSWFLWVGFVINLIGGVGYIIDTIKGDIQPNRVTFLIWPIAPLIIFFAQVQQHIQFESLFSLLVAVPPLLVFIASFFNKKSVWKLTRFDITCGFLSIVGIILWAITQQGNLAIILSIFADALASLPTIVKSYTHPETEVAWPWFAAVIYSALDLLTIKVWTFTSAAFSIYFFISVFLIFFFTFSKMGKGKKVFVRV